MVAHPKDPGKETLGTGKSLGCVHTNQTCFSSSLLLPAWLQEAASLLTLAPSSLPHRCNLFTSGLAQPLGCQHHLPPVSLQRPCLRCAALRPRPHHRPSPVLSSPPPGQQLEPRSFSSSCFGLSHLLPTAPTLWLDGPPGNCGAVLTPFSTGQRTRSLLSPPPPPPTAQCPP